MTLVRSNRITFWHPAVASVAILTLAACGGTTEVAAAGPAQTLIASVRV